MQHVGLGLRRTDADGGQNFVGDCKPLETYSQMQITELVLRLVRSHFVKGGRFYGALPSVSVNGPDDVGQGRLLPTTSVDQLAATLATWMGVPATDLPLVLPQIANYTQRDLGYF
jgi:hypothetical protein